jgi:ABC-2 type transport system permease protein
VRLYLEYIKCSFKVNTAYRVDVLLSIAKSILSLFISISIGVVLFDKSGNVRYGNGLIELNEMITYVILSTGISILVSNGIIGIVDRKIKSGEIAMDLISL